MCEHLYAHAASGWTADIVPFYYVLDLPHLGKVQFPCEHHDVGPLGIEAQGFGIGNAQLGGDMHLQAYAAGIDDCGHIRGYHSIDSGCQSRVQGVPHRFQLVPIEDYVKREIGLDTGFVTYTAYLAELLHPEVVRGMGTHIEFLHPEIHRIGSALNGCMQTFEIARRGHYLQFLPVHFPGISKFYRVLPTRAEA